MIREFFTHKKESLPNSVVTIEYDQSGGHETYWPELLLIKQGSRAADLAQYVPKGIALGPRPGLGDFTLGLNSIIFDPEVIEKDPRMILGLLHEIGHAVSNLDYDKDYDAAHVAARKKAEKTRDLTEEEGSVILADERNAWANALHIARDLRDKHGINVFDLFESHADVMLYLRKKGLDSYEKSYGKNDHEKESVLIKMFKDFFSPRRGLSKEFL